MDAYDLIKEHYGEQTTERTGVKLINHIDEGLNILENLNTTSWARDAYCLHPLLQSDLELVLSLVNYSDYFKDFHPNVLIYAMEYRSVANEYLSKRKIKSIDEIRLSPIGDVNKMLIADKIQNKKDFDKYHKETHPRSKELKQYFNNWLEKLGISEEEYQNTIKKIER